MERSSFTILSLYERDGRRKYLTPSERSRFIAAAAGWPRRDIGAFCLFLAYSGCRVSEALAVTRESFDVGEGFVAIRSLKKRSRFVVREIPLPTHLLQMLASLSVDRPAQLRIWPWSRGWAWLLVKQVMTAAAVPGGPQATPKGLRHGFGIHAIRSGVPLNLVQRWLGHASLSTTAIYANALGAEERELAARMWEE